MVRSGQQILGVAHPLASRRVQAVLVLIRTLVVWSALQSLHIHLDLVHAYLVRLGDRLLVLLLVLELLLVLLLILELLQLDILGHDYLRGSW